MLVKPSRLIWNSRAGRSTLADDTATVNASIVLIGKFNPAIFTPAWFAKNGLFSDAELAASELSVASNSITQFVMEWLTIEVQQNRFFLQVTSDPFLRVLDMTAKIFGELLPHSHVVQIGMNYSEAFILDSTKRRLALGRKLAPLGPWGEWGKKIGEASGSAVGGMVALIMRENYEPLSIGFRRVDVEPYDERFAGRGVTISVNDHRNIVGEKEQEDATVAVGILIECFEQSIGDAKQIVNELRNFAKELPI